MTERHLTFLCLAQAKRKGKPAECWLYEVAAATESEAGAIGMRCAEIAAQIEGFTAPQRILVVAPDSPMAAEWRDAGYDEWGTEYCADIAARFGVAQEAGQR